MMKKVAKPAGHLKTVRQLMLGTVGTLSVLAAGATTAHAKTITVKQGDTVWGIAQREGLTTDALEQANPSVSRLNNSIDLIYAGQQLTLPTSDQDGYIVRRGDTLSEIAARYHVTVEQLVKWNKISNPNLIFVGQRLAIKEGQTVVSSHSVEQQAVHANVQQPTTPVATPNNGQTAQVNTGQVQQPAQSDENVSPAEQEPAQPAANNDQSVATTDQQTVQQQQSENVDQVANEAQVNQAQAFNSFIAMPQASQPQQQVAAPQQQQAAPQTNAAQTNNNVDLQSGSVVSLATKLAHSNIPYVWGGSSLNGMDCSGLVSYVYAHSNGKQLPHYTVALEGCVTQKPVSQAQPGDLLFWGNHGSTYHVAIYIGNNQFVAAPQPGQNVDIETISPAFEPSFAGSVN